MMLQSQRIRPAKRPTEPLLGVVAEADLVVVVAVAEVVAEEAAVVAEVVAEDSKAAAAAKHNLSWNVDVVMLSHLFEDVPGAGPAQVPGSTSIESDSAAYQRYWPKLCGL